LDNALFHVLNPERIFTNELIQRVIGERLVLIKRELISIIELVNMDADLTEIAGHVITLDFFLSSDQLSFSPCMRARSYKGPDR